MDEYKYIKEEMRRVYLHDRRPWMIGYSGGKDSTLLCQLVFEMLAELPAAKRWKKVYIVTSDTMVENPIVKKYMVSSSMILVTFFLPFVISPLLLFIFSLFSPGALSGY